MFRTASPPRHGPEEGLWFFILIVVALALIFVATILFVQR
jgi:hypothetical protein